MLNNFRYSMNRMRFRDPNKFIEHLYKMKREDVSIPLRMPLGGIIMFTPKNDTPWPPEPNSDLDKKIRASVLAENSFIIS